MSSLDALAGTLGRLVETGRLVGRYGLRLDTNPVPAGWSHVTKVDPEDRKRLPIAFPRYLAHTDAVSVGGSADVTEANTVRTFGLLDPLDTPAFHEPSDATHVTRDTQSKAAFLAVPQVLNGDSDAFVGTFGEGVEYVREEMAPTLVGKLPFASLLPGSDRLAGVLAGAMLSDAVTEAYIVQNPDSAAARESGVTPDDVLGPTDAKRRAMAAEYVLESEICYLEYSGTYGGDEAAETLTAIDEGVEWTRVWYGGGVDSREKATAVLEAGADAVVVGDVFHEVAAEEATLAARFLADEDSDPDGPDTDPAAWLDDTVDVADTIAARYLSTIPAVDDPVAEARRCLAAGIRARRAVATEDGRIEDGTVRIGADTVEVVAREVGIGVDDPAAFATRLVAGLVRDGESTFPAEKIAELPDIF